MRRRDVVKLIAGTAVAWPLVARAQQSAIPVIGFMHGSSPEVRQLAAFRVDISDVTSRFQPNALFRVLRSLSGIGVFEQIEADLFFPIAVGKRDAAFLNSLQHHLLNAIIGT